MEKPRANPGDTFAAAHHAMNEAVRNVAKKVQDVVSTTGHLDGCMYVCVCVVQSHCECTAYDRVFTYNVLSLIETIV